ncbi:hypothetical protein BC830DRAFT_1103126 [Chytriomyces sp. MP71]|nr:hypothetical protein BC830DRAFT_1103126 [Chytriomyces sp. MP71]
MTTMDNDPIQELVEGGGGVYAGYTVPVQPRKQIAATKREFVGGSVPGTGFAKQYHSVSTDEWKNTPPHSVNPEPGSKHAHTSSQQASFGHGPSGSRPSTQAENYTATGSSSQGTQTRYNLRPYGAPSSNKPTTSVAPRTFARPELAGVESLMVSGKNVERLKTANGLSTLTGLDAVPQQKEFTKVPQVGNSKQT